MRLIGTLNREIEAKEFSRFLTQRHVPHHYDINQNRDWGSDQYGEMQCQIWVDDEEHVEEAFQWLEKFKENPRDPFFNAPLSLFEKEENSEEHSTSWEKIPIGIVTKTLLILCSLIFIFTEFFSPMLSYSTKTVDLPIFTSPIEKELLYDYPKTYELISDLLSRYGGEAIENPNQLPKEGQYLINTINQTPYWQGLYEYILLHKLDSLGEIPKFEKLHQGEIWRLVTPIFLHGSILHILFNMLWLIIVGKQLEFRLKPLLYVIFILITAVISNTAQYLVSGPNFIGISGVIAGMIGFIWIRQREAPWESYQLDRSTLIFITVFIFGIAALQSFLFVAQYFFHVEASAGIANTAHLTGAAVGIALAKLPFFRWK